MNKLSWWNSSLKQQQEKSFSSSLSMLTLLGVRYEFLEVSWNFESKGPLSDSTTRIFFLGLSFPVWTSGLLIILQDSREAVKEEKSMKRILIISSLSNLGKQKSLHVFSISTPSEAFLSWQALLFHEHSKKNLWTLACHSQVWKCEFHGSLFLQPPDVDERGRMFYCVFSSNRERSVLKWACFPPTQVATMWPGDS